MKYWCGTSLVNQVRQCPRGSLREVRTANRRAIRRHRYGDIERFRNGRSIFTPPRELQAPITNALRATGQLDDFEVAAIVLAGAMKKVHLRHRHYQKEAACGQPYPHPPDRRPEPRDVWKVWPRRQGINVGGRTRLTQAGTAGEVFQFPASITSVVDAPRLVSSDARPTRPEWAVNRLDAGRPGRRLEPQPHHLR